MKTKQVVIVGAGPAGMMLAYQLASNGVRVRVLERHPDFEREFRGELVQGSNVEQLEKAGIFQLLLDRGMAIPDVERRMFLGQRRRVSVPGPREIGAVVSQPGFLGLLHELCSKLPEYQLEFSNPVIEAIKADGRVVAVRTKAGTVDGDLFVVCNGRNSPLRGSFGLETEVFETTANALWLRFDLSSDPDALPTSVDVHMFGRGVVTVTHPTSHQRLHIAYSAPGDLARLKRNIPELKRRLLPTLNERIRGHVDAQLTDTTDMQVLKIVVDRVKRWYAPGILFLGDAAHTMSPSGGQGLNVALRDTYVAANHLVPALRASASLDDDLLQKIQQEREAEISAIQARQTSAGRMVLKPLPILHVMFTILLVAKMLMKKRLSAGNGVSLPQPDFLSPTALRPGR